MPEAPSGSQGRTRRPMGVGGNGVPNEIPEWGAGKHRLHPCAVPAQQNFQFNAWIQNANL